jgi:hypothetical protein
MDYHNIIINGNIEEFNYQLGWNIIMKKHENIFFYATKEYSKNKQIYNYVKLIPQISKNNEKLLGLKSLNNITKYSENGLYNSIKKSKDHILFAYNIYHYNENNNKYNEYYNKNKKKINEKILLNSNIIKKLNSNIIKKLNNEKMIFYDNNSQNIYQLDVYKNNTIELNLIESNVKNIENCKKIIIENIIKNRILHKIYDIINLINKIVRFRFFNNYFTKFEYNFQNKKYKNKNLKINKNSSNANISFNANLIKNIKSYINEHNITNSKIELKKFENKLKEVQNESKKYNKNDITKQILKEVNNKKNQLFEKKLKDISIYLFIKKNKNQIEKFIKNKFDEKYIKFIDILKKKLIDIHNNDKLRLSKFIQNLFNKKITSKIVDKILKNPIKNMNKFIYNKIFLNIKNFINTNIKKNYNQYFKNKEMKDKNKIKFIENRIVKLNIEQNKKDKLKQLLINKYKNKNIKNIDSNIYNEMYKLND